jgi:hypothetical protein
VHEVITDAPRAGHESVHRTGSAYCSERPGRSPAALAWINHRTPTFVDRNAILA